jgi:chitodextrinase
MSIYATYTPAPPLPSTEPPPPPSTELPSGADRQPPSLPPGLTMTGATETTITIAWTPSTDEVGVAGYRLYRDGVAVATTTQTTYTFTGLTCGTSYTLAYEAFDAAGNTTNRNEATTVRSTTSCPVAAPSNTLLPSISGIAQVGQSLVVLQGSWTGSPTSYAYQWLRCDSAGAACSPIPGATASSYTVASADVSRTLRATVTATNSGGSTSATSVQTLPTSLPASPPVNTALPTISGVAQVRSTLSTSAGTWTGSPTPTYSYEWRRCDGGGANCAAIPGAQGQTYTLAITDQAATLRVAVTATNSAGSATAVSMQTTTVAPPPSASPGGANLWIDTTAGDNTCVRSASPAAYDSARACSSFVAACGRAQGGDIVHFANGVYHGETVLRSACDPASSVTFAAPADGNVEFQGTWLFGSSPAVGPRKVKIEGWRFRGYTAGSDRIGSYGVQNFHADRVAVSSWNIDGPGSWEPAEMTNLLIENSTFFGCDGDLNKGFTAENCINRIIGPVDGVMFRSNRFFGYPPNGHNGCIMGGNPGCPRGVAFAVIMGGGVARNITFDGNRFWGNGVTNIRFQPRGGAVLENVTIRNNWFRRTWTGEGAAFSIDEANGGVFRNFTIVGNSMAGGIANTTNFPTNTLLAGNVLTWGNGCPANITFRYNYKVRESAWSGQTCDASEILQAWPGTAYDFSLLFISTEQCRNTGLPGGVGCTIDGGVAPDLRLLPSVATALDNAWPAADCVARLSADHFGTARPVGTSCDIGAHER